MKKKNILLFTVLTILVIAIGLLINQGGATLFTFNSTPAPAKDSQLVAQADQLYQQGKYTEAYNLYSQSIAAGEGLASAYSGQGNILVKQRHFMEASFAYSAALKIEQSPQVLASRCNVYRLLAKFDEALADCEKSIELDPTYIDSYLALSALHLEQGDKDKAEDVANQALEVNAQDARAVYLLAQIALLKGESDNAIAAFSQAIQLDPDNPQYYWDRGFTYYMTGQLSKTKEDMQRVVDLGNPDIDGELIYKAGSLMQSLQGVP